MDWPDFSTARLANWRTSAQGIHGELTVSLNGIRYSWGSWQLASTTARMSLAKYLTEQNSQIPWRAHLDECAFRFTCAAREGEPLTVLGAIDAGDDAETLLPGWLYAGEPTLLYADGDVGKSLTALALSVAMQTGRALPGGLVPARAVRVAYLDWETSKATTNRRLWMLAAGLGMDPPPILYKRMTRPLVEEIGTLSAEFAQRQVGVVIIDSQMFAVAMGEGGAFHEPITQFFTALRLFAPAAVLILNHVTNADARTGTPARPFGGAFSFNGPRVIWEAIRDWDTEDATAIVFLCKKANNLARKPASFGLCFRGPASEPDRLVRVEALNVAGVDLGARGSLKDQVRAALQRHSPQTAGALAETVGSTEHVVRTLLNRHRNTFVAVPESTPRLWSLHS